MNKRAADIFRRAKEIIIEPGKWCQYATADQAGRHCLLGAINKAAHGYHRFNDETRLLGATFFPKVGASLPHLFGPLYGVAAWNNAPERTHADVMAAFDRVIALAEGRLSDEAYTAKFISDMTASVGALTESQ